MTETERVGMLEHTVRDLKDAYKKARENNKIYFSIAGYDFFIDYGKYLIEYLDMNRIPDTIFLRNILVRGKN